ncbi:MAG: FG-GAP-like repeat-containing protein [Ignavibacteriaceae bacterium]
MKHSFSILLNTMFFTLIFLFQINAQTEATFIPDLDGLAPVSTVIAESGNYSDMYDPGFTVYPGFPKEGLYTVISPKTGAIYCNMDADPDMEIIFGAGETLYAVNLDGTAVTGWPKTFTQYYEAVWAVSFGDIDGDGEGEIVAGIGGPLGGHIQAFKKDGSVVTGFPVNVGRYPMTPILADLDGNGSMEIILGTRTGEAYVYKGDGTVYPGWPILMDRYVASSAAAGDVNNDGVMDIVMESRNRLYVWNKDGQSLPGFPYAVMDSLIGSNSYSAPVLADLTNDGKLEIVFCSHSDSTNAGGIIYAVKYDGTNLPGWPNTVPNWIYGAPIVADIDGDTELEIIIGEYGASPTPYFNVFAYNVDGSSVANFPMGPYHGSANQITVADIDNDGMFEIIFDENVTENGLGRYRALNMDGSQVTGWPLELNQNTSFQQPLLGDLNNDGTLDMVGGSFNFDINNKQVFLYAWNTGLPYDPTKIVNPMYQFNPQHTGKYVDPSTIPVELESFMASVNNNEVILNWVTASELNNMGFEIEKRAGNRQSAVGSPSGGETSWEKIGFVDGKGTTTEKTYYTFTDDQVLNGKNFYRLKQIDFDGTITYSKEIEIDFNLPYVFKLEQNYPNPFNPATIIKYNIPQESSVQLKVINILGELVHEFEHEIQSAGNYTKLFNASHLSSGVYFTVMTATSSGSGKVFTSKIKMIYLK